MKEMALAIEPKNAKNRVITGERTLNSLVMDIPGMVCKHGCSYVACRGLVLSPISGILIITHGPVGCSYYSWGGNRLRHQAANAEHDYYRYSFSTQMDESDVIFGGEKKLKQAIKEVVEMFHPPVIAVCSTCPVGLIGDDVKSIAEEAEKEYGVKVMPFSCEGFRSVPGYRLATMGMVESVMGGGKGTVGRYPVNIIGEFYNGLKAGEIARIFDHIGYDIVSVLMGDGSYEGLENAHQAKLNLFGSDKAVADLADVMRDRFGIDWMGFNFIGMDNIVNSLRNMAAFFGSPELICKTEELIAEELGMIEDSMKACKAKLRNRIAVVQEDEFVSRHYQALLSDLDVNPVMVGNELFCRSGQNEMSFMSAMESGCGAPGDKPGVRYDIDLEHYHISLPARLYEKIKTRTTISSGNIVHSPLACDRIMIPHLAQNESELMLDDIRPDIFFPGIKDKFAGVGSGYTSCFFNADDFRFDYGGFSGAIHLARDLSMAIDMSSWQNNVAPWKSRPNAREVNQND